MPKLQYLGSGGSPSGLSLQVELYLAVTNHKLKAPVTLACQHRALVSYTTHVSKAAVSWSWSVLHPDGGGNMALGICVPQHCSVGMS